MRSRLVLALAMLTAVLATAPVASARPWADRTCSNANGPPDLREVAIGPLAAVGGVNVFANPGFFASYYDDDTRQYGAKTPISVRKGRSVTVSIAWSDRDVADLAFGFGRHGQRRQRDAVRFAACPRGRGHGRGWSTWPGGFRLTEPACVGVVARERGSRRVHRATLSFGMGDACGT
jgi:hypothetical protein